MREEEKKENWNVKLFNTFQVPTIQLVLILLLIDVEFAIIFICLLSYQITIDQFRRENLSTIFGFVWKMFFSGIF